MSNWTMEYTMHRKSESLDRFKRYKAYAELHTNKVVKSVSFNEFEGSPLDPGAIKVKCLRSDNGGEYLSNDFKTYLEANGIKHELTVAYTPQQNGVAERMNRTLMNLVRSMLHHKRVEKRFWAEALATAVYVRNRVTSRALSSNTTPHHIWNSSPPDLSHMRVFGSLCWYVVPRNKVQKLDARSREALLMGYSKQSKGYKLWDVKLDKFIVSRDVSFDEDNQSSTPSEDEEPTSNFDSEQALPDQSSNLRRSSRVVKPREEWWKASSSSTSNLKANESVNHTALIIANVPQSYEEANSAENIDYWLPGIRKEEESIRKNETFTLVERTPKMHVIPCRYVFRIKANVGPKVRIVAKGFRQIQGVEYYDTYAPVVSLTAVRLFLAIVACNDLHCDQMDVVTAFLNGDLTEEVYMEVPPGFRDPKRPNLVCRLLKAIYGLKQAPKQWYAKINSFLVDDLKFQACSSEPCLYLKHTKQSILTIILYVDDLLIAGSNELELKEIKLEFKHRFQMKDLGAASEFVGIQIYPVCDSHGASITKQSSSASEMAKASNDIPYRQAIGSLMYLSLGTRPDIAFAVNRLAQFCESPSNRIGKPLNAYYATMSSYAKIDGRNLSELHNTILPQQVSLFIDNQGAISSSKNHSINARNKHIDIKYHFVRDAVAQNFIDIQYCPSADQLADMLTKSVSRTLLEDHRSKLGLELLEN
eukprot:IDg23532t1